ncbi:hypothetical protein SDC9_97566 [bioreactor metagenome]|uniref:Uncharacterized protein n=1 Tax=bioreactor metagenome TaxID=1076179 RepID=A0A645AC95_9ZZZZ
MDVHFDGIVFRGQTEGVEPDGEQNVIPLHPLFAADDVHGGIGPGMANVQSLPRGVGKLDQAVELRPGHVAVDSGEGLFLQPLCLPFLFDAGKIIFHFTRPFLSGFCPGRANAKNAPLTAAVRGVVTRYHPDSAAGRPDGPLGSRKSAGLGHRRLPRTSTRPLGPSACNGAVRPALLRFRRKTPGAVIHEHVSTGSHQPPAL